jgi:hypothetical protein
VTDPLAAEATEGAAPEPQAPALTEDRIKAMLAEANAKSDERVRGLQSSLGRQLTDLRKENEALKRRLPADADDDRAHDLDAERRRLERERDLWKAAASNPGLAPLLTSLNEAEGPEGWAEVLSAWQSASAPASPPAAVEDTYVEPTPAVDPNRNIRQPSGWGPAGPTEEQSLSFLRGTDWPKG